MEHRLDYKLDAAEPRHRPILQTCCWSFWRYAALHCLVETKRVFDELEGEGLTLTLTLTLKNTKNI